MDVDGCTVWIGSMVDGYLAWSGARKQRTLCGNRVFSLVSNVKSLLVWSHRGAPAGADRNLLLFQVLKREQRAGHYCIRSYLCHPQGGKTGCCVAKLAR